MTYTPAVADGPANDTPGIALGPNLQREDLSRVQPGNRQPRGTENCRVEEHEERCSTTDVALAGLAFGIDGCASQPTGDQHANALANSPPVQSPTTTDAIDGEDTDQGGELTSR